MHIFSEVLEIPSKESNLLEKYRDYRLSAAELINHPWIKMSKAEYAPKSSRKSPMPLQMKEMLKFDEQGSLRLLTL